MTMNLRHPALTGLIATTALAGLLGFLIAQTTGLIVAAMLLLGVISYSFLQSDQNIFKAFHLKKLVGSSAHDLNGRVKKIANTQGVRVPLIYMSNQPYAQAFVFGRSLNKPKLVIFSLLLERLNEQEIETLLNLLVSQIKLQRQVSHSITVLMLQIIFSSTLFLDNIFRFLSGVKFCQHKMKSNIFTYTFSPFIYFFLSFFQTQSHLLMADSQAAIWSKDKHKVARLISKIHSYSLHAEKIPSLQYCHIFLTSPLTSLDWARYLKWQPNLKIRTKKLLGHYPA